MTLRAVKTPQQEGRDYEEELAARYGGRAQPGSGAGHRFKLDCKLGPLLISAKKTIHASYRLTAEELRETFAGSQGPGGRGEQGIMVVGMADYPDDVFIVPGQVMRSLLEGEVELEPTTTRRSAKLAAASKLR